MACLSDERIKEIAQHRWATQWPLNKDGPPADISPPTVEEERHLKECKACEKRVIDAIDALILQGLGATRKSEPMASELDLMTAAMSGLSRTDAINDSICVDCKGPATEFRTEAAAREYRISGLCQTCQDAVFRAT